MPKQPIFHIMPIMQIQKEGRQITVGVYGLGCKGLEAALHLARKGYYVVASDPDPDRPEMLRAGCNYIREVSDSEISEQLELRHLAPTWDITEFMLARFVLLCPTMPIHLNMAPQNRYILQL